MPRELIIRLDSPSGSIKLPATLLAAGEGAASHRDPRKGPELLLTGDRSYLVALHTPLDVEAIRALHDGKNRLVHVIFRGRKPVRRRIAEVRGLDVPTETGGVALDLTSGRKGARPLWLRPDGTFGSSPDATAVKGGPETFSAAAEDEILAKHEALITAARWISSRRTTTFERLFPASAFHPDEPDRDERLSIAQATRLIEQLKGALNDAAVGGEAALHDPVGAAQIRSAVLTILSHLVATSLKDRGFSPVSEASAAVMFSIIDAEEGHESARAALRAHAITLLQLRGPALRPQDQARARVLLRGLLREAPPYDEMKGPWRFAMCSAHDFHEGEVEILEKKFKFRPIPLPEGTPEADGGRYHAFEAPFKTPHGDPIQVFARIASPSNENFEMGQAFFTGLLINRHAQLGSYDMRAASIEVQQVGYKFMMNSQCAGLTTRFAISRMFPDADIYSSWDSTYFRAPAGRVVESEGLDCFIAALEGMSRRATHAAIEAAMRKVQWHHSAAQFPGFSQFVGPANPLVVNRFNDVNQDGRADVYDGFLDFHLAEIAEDLHASLTPRDPGVTATQVGGEAAEGLNWAAGSLNRVAQYSDVWAGLPGGSELLYVFQSGGFFSPAEPPCDVPLVGLQQDLGFLPAVCRYQKVAGTTSGLQCEVLFNSRLSHAAKELKRLLCAADALWRAFDLGYMPKEGPMKTRLGQRAALLLTLAGLLEFPADQNFVDGLWSMALEALNLPDISRSVVRACITDEDHDASNYYGSKRGIMQLVGGAASPGGAVAKADPVAFERLASDDPTVGRAREIARGSVDK
ncbi:MAG: hypothetical protein HUU21_07760 [Polyangiaceae bacterium]|nr:hypothetical protein [Polyangiaceae bacterium]